MTPDQIASAEHACAKTLATLGMPATVSGQFHAERHEVELHASMSDGRNYAINCGGHMVRNRTADELGAFLASLFARHFSTSEALLA
jgi:hypothetical protein